MVDFLILYEHIVREIESDTLIAAELERRGYKVRIHQLLDTRKLSYLTYNKPKVILTSAMYDNETLNSFVYNNVGTHNKVINLHWEQVLSREQEDMDFYNSKDAAALCLHTCWGEASKDRLVRNGLPPENAYVTGPVHYDFFREPFAEMFFGKEKLGEKYNLDSKKNWLLIISSYTAAYMSPEELAEMSEITGFDYPAFRDLTLASMTDTLGWFERYLNESDDDSYVIYRPHPSEWDSPILRLMQEKYPRFRVISDLSIREWIVACDIIYSWMSTSIPEVYFAGKSAHVLRPYPISEVFDPVIYEGVFAIDNYDDFLPTTTAKNPPFPIDEKLLRYHYDYDSYPSYMRICDLCEEVLKRDDLSKPFSKFKGKYSVAKWLSLYVFHFIRVCRINPLWFQGIIPSVAKYTDRILGYIKKDYIPKSERKSLIAKMKGLLFKYERR